MAISPADEGYDGVWSEFLTRISTMVTKQTLETWFKPMRLSSIDDKTVSIECPSKFFMDWVVEHHKDKVCYVFTG
jgi:chromosomal replication initiation ATPase DnaA